MSSKDVQVNWLIEDGPFEEELEPLIAEIDQQGHSHKLIKYQPFASGIYEDLYPQDACVIFYGSINLARQLQRETPWIPGPLVNFQNYKCSTYYAHWGKHLLNSDYIMLPYSELCRRRHEICKKFGHLRPEESYLFIRPDDGVKSFGGHVVSEKDFQRLEGPVGGYAKPDTLVIASSPKGIYHEWRIVICDRKAISGCQYMFAERLSLSPEVPDAVWDMANEIASSEWQPDRMYVLDIANWGSSPVQSSEKFYGDLFLVEANSFSCAGLYCSDMKPIVEHASKVALEEWKSIHEI